MGRISKDAIKEACIKGIRNSFNEYIAWSGEEWLYRAPEYLITVNIAKELWKQKGKKFITLEDNVREILENANFQEKIPDNARPEGRIDIVLWWGGKGTPRGLIEVKHRVAQAEKIFDDMDRITSILEGTSDFQFGISAFYLDWNYKDRDAHKKLEEKIKIIYEDTLEHLKGRGRTLSYLYQIESYKDDDKNSRAYVVFMVE
jgi:hypothetical protein